MQALSTTVKGAADMIGCGRTTIYSLINDGRLQTYKLGRRTLVKTESIHALVNQAA
jgi:excisionase family DNA binding protein